MTVTDITDTFPLDTAVLAAVDRLSGPDIELVRWAAIRSRIPGEFWEQTAALVRLVDSGRLHHIKIHGTPYVWPGDELSLRAARQRRTA